MDVIKYYRGLIENTEGVLDMMISTTGSSEALIISHNYLLEYDILKSSIAERPEVSVLNLAVKEYQYALFALISGQYRHAFVGLRLFFELMLATVQFSAHEIDFRLWIKNSKDINWGALKDNQNGVFSINFIRAFNPEFAEHGKEFLAIAEAVYRECSEFVHGNADTHTILSSDINFQEKIFLSWHKTAKNMRIVIIFIFSARYLNYISQEKMDHIETIITDVLGYLTPVQEIFSRPLGGK